MGDSPSMQDRDLLSRLNALKKSTIELDAAKYTASSLTSSNTDVSPPVARDLHNSILDRFRTLRGDGGLIRAERNKPTSGTSLDVPELQNEENDKTVEDLLAELGPEEEWTINKQEEDEVNTLLRDAKSALADASSTNQLDSEPNDLASAHQADQRPQSEGDGSLFNIDLPESQQEPQTGSDEDDDHDKGPQSKAALKQSLNKDADDVLQRVLDELKLEDSEDSTNKHDTPVHGSQSRNTSPSQLNLPSPSPSPIPTDMNHTNDLLTLPSAPTTTPITKPHHHHDHHPPSTSTRTSIIPDEEIATWCIICTDDATLQCLGCDGDLYCTNCWMEGHRGDGVAVGVEERRHRAVQYSKRKSKKKEEVGKGKVAV